MESQDPDDWQLPSSQLSVDPKQPSTSRWHVQDEAEPSECCIHLRIEPGIPQFTLLVLQLENKALVIVLKFEPALSKSYQMMFKGCFENNAKEQMISRLFALLSKVISFDFKLV